MFTDKFTISFDPTTFGLKQLQLDTEKMKEVFTSEEIDLINDLSFFEENVLVPLIATDIPSKDKTMVLDSFGIGMYDFIKGCIQIIAMAEEEFKTVLEQHPHLISKEHLAERMALGKEILYKYCPETKGKLF